MGISANQARMLTLKGRKCDLEKEMQIILNNKLQIAQETSEVAHDYNNAVSNRKLFVFSPSTDAAQDTFLSMSPSNLFIKADYLIAVKQADGSYSQLTQANINNIGVEEGLRTGEYILVKEATMQTQDPQVITFENATYGGGSIIGTDHTDANWEVVDWRSSTQIMDKLDSSDDLQAQTAYEKSMADLNVKETKMNVEMKKIETEHASISNEIESVDKIMKKNTEDSYKYFA